MKLRFLGTGGGRYVTGEQIRRTAGIVVETEESQVHVDPGPGALVYANEELDEPLETDAVVVSHGHLDHANDAQAIIEMMTESGDKPGAIFANETVLHGHADIEKWISNHHQEKCRTVETLEEGSEHEFQDIEIRAQQMFHSDPKTAGFIIETDEKTVGFWTDTEYSDELADFYSGTDVMVVYCTLKKGDSISSHTSIDDIPDIMERVDAGTVIVTHFGYSILDSGLAEQEEWLKEQVDAKVVFAEDGMEFPGNRRLGDF
ncbi:MAG: MBL fold metallo-hydrolase [Candidatus Nanohaloarchaea archaeon]